MERFRPMSWPTCVEESAFRPKKVSCPIAVHAEYRRDTHRSEGATLVDSIYRDTGCIVVAFWEQSTIKRFDVYAGADLKGAVATINKWISRGDQKSRESSVWAKTPAFNQDQWYQGQLELKEQERMELFLGPVPDTQEGEALRPRITVDWPEDLLGVEATPPTVFGNALQALDDIRKRDGVFITLLPNNKIEILGFDIINVEAAEAHYRTLVERIRSEKCSLQQATNIILDQREGIDVVLLPAEKWWPNHAHRVVPRLLPSPIMDHPGSFREDGLGDGQLRLIWKSIAHALEAVSYKKSSYEFVVRLGCIALDSKKVGEEQIGRRHGKETFIKSIDGQIDLVAKKWLFNNVDWTDDGEGVYDKTDSRFYKLEAGKGGAKVNMDINLLELGESRAWSFALESMMPMPRSMAPPVLTGFAERVVIRPGYDMASSDSFAKWDKSPSVDASLQHWRLDKVYSFGVRETCYNAELTAMWYPKQSLPCWGLAVRHTEWATHLAELERLQTGHQASWSNAIVTFLPKDGGSSIALDEDDDWALSKLKLGSNAEELQQGPSWEGVRTLTNTLLRLSGIVSLVTMRERDAEV
ncbi:hypothetical protein N0V95_002133 [Ascochyta clinopodiicola]|nr:hypothetical protein N0V95_002133 [Ascochyta clinopodiicola]